MAHPAPVMFVINWVFASFTDLGIFVWLISSVLPAWQPGMSSRSAWDICVFWVRLKHTLFNPGLSKHVIFIQWETFRWTGAIK